MKKFMILGLITLMFVIDSFSQSNPKKDFNPDKKAKMKAEKFSDEVDINNEQKEALTQALSAYYTEMKALKQKDEKDPEAMKALKQRKNERIKAALGNETHYEAYREFAKKEKMEHRKKHHKKNGEHRGEWKEKRSR